MPVALVGIPVAVALAWWLLKGGPFRMPRFGGPPPGDFGGAGGLEASTRRLTPGEEESFKRDELPFERGPSMWGGEIGGPYGPATQEQAPSAPEDGYAEPPAATQTAITWQGQTPDPGPAQWQGQAPAPGPAQWQGPTPDPGPAQWQGQAPVYVPPPPPPPPMGVRRAQ